MQNVEITLSADKKTATITIDLTQRGKESSSGKSIQVASTGGNVPIEGTEIILGLNAYVKKAR